MTTSRASRSGRAGERGGLPLERQQQFEAIGLKVLPDENTTVSKKDAPRVEYRLEAPAFLRPAAVAGGTACLYAGPEGEEA